MDKWTSTEKYKRINKILDIMGIVIVIVLIGMTFINWGKSPDIVPIHYNFRGEVDGYGSKNTLFILLPIAIITYMGLAILSKYPEIYNYAVEINPRNKEKQYSMASTFIRIINIETLGIFFYIQIVIGSTMSSESSSLSMAFLPIAMIILFGSIGFYIYKSVKCK